MKTPKTLMEAIAYFSNEEQAHSYFVSLRWPNGVCCPRCGCVEPSYISTRRIWKCKGCRRQFSAKVGTIFEDSPLPLGKWMTAIWLIVNAKNGISSCEVARSIGVKQTHAWHMMHRIRAAMDEGSFHRLSGAVEVDDTFIGGREKNRHHKKRKHLGTGGIGKEVVAGYYCGGHVHTDHVADIDPASVKQHVREHVEAGSTLHTDQAAVYNNMPEYDRVRVNHTVGQYVKDGATTNHLENYWSILKRTVSGSYIHVSGGHLHRYLDEQEFRYNNREAEDGERFLTVIRSVGGKRLTYSQLTAG